MPKKKTVSDTKSLTLLGQKQTKAMKQLETFKCPNNIQKVVFETDEVTSNCPKTGQPDFYKVKIEYTPKTKCIESKALKLYLWIFRDTGQFCEDLSQIILRDIVEACDPLSCRIVLKMAPRGGITIESFAEFGDMDLLK